ncbi:MAG: serine/threonine-protein kinase [Polyangiales bacterium]
MADPTASIRSAPPAQPDPLIGRVINDRFRILGVIARGGMGKVYRAEQSPLGRVVALKVLQPNYKGENDPEFDKRFFLEASIVSKLRHPHTVTLYDYGQTDDGVYFMAMEYLEGRTLHRLLRDEGPLDPARALRVLLQTCRALREAHGHGVIHRDLKPANVFLIQHDEDPDFVKVLDFGLLKRTDEDPEEALTQTGLFMGSPKYMAPEQIRGERVSAATDVYSLGVILYEMLTGRVPFDRPSSVNLLMAHVTDPVPPLHETNPAVSVPPAVEALVYRCLAKTPEERFASMDELIAAIKHAAPAAHPGFATGTGEFASSGQSLAAAHLLSSGEHPASLRPAVPTTPPPLPVTPSGASASAAPAAPAEVHVTHEPPRRRAPLMLLGAAAVFFGAVGLGLLGLRATQRPEAGSAQPARATTVSVALESDPPGAEVFEGGVSLGRTPLRAQWTGERGDPNRPHTLVFRAAGYHEHQVTLSGPALAYLARLQRDAPPEAVIPAPAFPAEAPPAEPPAAEPSPAPAARPARSAPRRPRQPPTRNAQGLYNNVY